MVARCPQRAPSPTSALLSAVLPKAAMLVILRYYILISRSISSAVPQNMLLVFGLLSILVAAFSMIRKRHQAPLRLLQC